MLKFLMPMLLICALTSGCKTVSATNACAGWQMLPMKLETAVYVTMNDRPLANGIAGHNLHGRKQGCWE